jgi:hypothetical protein
MAEANESNIKEINAKERSLDTLESSKFDNQLNYIGTNRT